MIMGLSLAPLSPPARIESEGPGGTCTGLDSCDTGTAGGGCAGGKGRCSFFTLSLRMMGYVRCATCCCDSSTGSGWKLALAEAIGWLVDGLLLMMMSDEASFQ